MIFLIFFFGLLVGSFLNTVIYRLGSPLSIFAKSSACPHCAHPLAWADLVPVVSFFALRGRCRYCKKPISWQYPLVELATAITFTTVYLKFPNLDLTTYYLLLATCFLIIIFVYDLKHFLILDKVVFPAAGLALLYQIWQGNWQNALLGAALLSGFFGLLYLVSRGRWIGLGDVKLGIFLGLLIPFPQTLALFFLAYLMGAVVSLQLIAYGLKTFHDRLPFGTFLTLAAFVAMMWGGEITAWYFRLIGIK